MAPQDDNIPLRKHCHPRRHLWLRRGTVVMMTVVTMMTTLSQLIGYRRHSHNMFPLSQRPVTEQQSYTDTARSIMPTTQSLCHCP